MLLTLSIRDFVIVDYLELDFSTGFTVLTGETGAGKSILIDALQMLLGSRSDLGVIREGATKCDLSATFSLNHNSEAWLTANDLTDEPNQVVIRRTLDSSGRSRAWINGISSPLSQLKQLGELLLDIHGQHAHQSLLNRSNQLSLLDGFAHLESELSSTKQAFQNWQKSAFLLKEAKEKQESYIAEIERLSWLLNDLDELSPQKDEWTEINEEHRRLSKATEIVESCYKSREQLTENEDSALSSVDAAIFALENIVSYAPKLQTVVENLIEARELVEGASDDVERFLDRSDLDSSRLDELEQRLSAYFNVARKHRLDPENLFNTWLQTQRRLEELQNQSNLNTLEEETKKTLNAYFQQAEKLSVKRKLAAMQLGKLVTAAMQELAMTGGSFEVALDVQEAPSPLGAERCEFLVAGHAGVSLRPLAKIASGGELSRISLAISVIGTSNALVDTLIFDEVDSGIGGAVAETVGHQLQCLGKKHQVLCVTHLPQVACCAEHHWKITKTAKNGNNVPTSSVAVLDEASRIEEISRMLGGINITETTKEHAKEMLGL